MFQYDGPLGAQSVLHLCAVNMRKKVAAEFENSKIGLLWLIFLARESSSWWCLCSLLQLS